jgi:hypothetical protein
MTLGGRCAVPEGRREGVVGGTVGSSTSEYGMGVFSKEVFSINTGQI